MIARPGSDIGCWITQRALTRRMFPAWCLLSALLAVFLPLSAGAAPEGPPLPAPSGFVTDKAEVIDENRDKQIVALLGELEKRTGAALAVLTVQTTHPLDDLEYAQRVMDLWRLGSGSGQRGLLMLVAVRDRRVRIVSGRGLQRIFPQEKIDAIVDERIVPQFKEGHYGLGILSGLWALSEEIAIESRIKLSFESPSLTNGDPGRTQIAAFSKLLGVLVALLVGGLLWFVWRDYRRQGAIKVKGGPGGPPAGGGGSYRGGQGGGFGGAGRGK
ncbi:MAG: TPM domain-containing protein [Deltaproteobacteria bacterium]|nr:TPM domain-containing protein [Deltaproteobacteria bacterium]